jgi:hypothetical protein
MATNNNLLQDLFHGETEPHMVLGGFSCSVVVAARIAAFVALFPFLTK